jgi:predicted nucleic acid-binding protein
MIAVDTNLLVYLLLPSPLAPLAEAVFTNDQEWVAPALIHSEFRNVIVGAIRRKAIDAQDAYTLLARSADVVIVPDGAPNPRDVLALALQSGCSAYDCEFVWLARELQVTLVTSDKKVIAAFPGIAVTPEAFLGTKGG